jgi:hypothetical protein
VLIALCHRLGRPGRLSLEVHLARPACWWHWLPGLRWDRQWGGLLEVTVRLGLGWVVYIGVSPKAERAEQVGGAAVAAVVPGSGRGLRPIWEANRRRTAMTNDSNLTTSNSLPYDPIGPLKPDRRVGRLTVKGNDSFATVCKPGLVPCAIHLEDNADGLPAGQPASAFERAAAWAAANQDKAAPRGMFG